MGAPLDVPAMGSAGDWLSPRRPDLPAPLELYEIAHPAVPPELDGLRILHLTDLHVRRPQGPGSTLGRLGAVLGGFEFDLVLLTGDCMDAPGEEAAALGELERLSRRWRTRYGAFGIFGNHDSGAFQERARALTRIRWIENETVRVEWLPVRLLGASFPEDVLGSALAGDGAEAGADRVEWGGDRADGAGSARGLTLGMVHYPTEIHACAAVGVPIVFSGHTHGGQIRVSPTLCPHTSSDLPAHLASGVLRLGGSLCVISRGLGEGVVEVRVNCPPQALVAVLRHGPIEGDDADGAHTHDSGEAGLRMVRAW